MISGIINLKKEAGMTSHDAVFKLRKILQERKIGHGGTLDPDVTGVLPIALGKATRLIEFMQEEGKIYEGEITLGFSTTTEDASGDIVERSQVPTDLSEEIIDQAMQTFLGIIEQVPPMYSAVKVNGRKLYEYARAGQSVERPIRQVQIHEFMRTSPLRWDGDVLRFDFRVVCGKGTYVRTLAVDLGASLNLPSHMSRLVRTASSGLQIDEALTLIEITEKVTQDDWSFLLPLESGLGDLKRIDLDEQAKQDAVYGRFFSLSNSDQDVLAGFFEDKLVAILEKRGDLYKPRKVFL